MCDENPIFPTLGLRAVLAGAVASAGMIGAAQTAEIAEPDVSKPAPEGLPKPNQGSILAGRVAVVTGAARGIGRAIARETAANGADVIAIDICGPVSSASNALPASPAELEETADVARRLGRKCKAVHADIRDIAAFRAVAANDERDFGKVDILVANAAI